MIIRGIIFDVNGTLIDIKTDEDYEEIYRAVSHFLTYYGIKLHRWEVKEMYYRIMCQRREASGEKYPEFDAVEVWRKLIGRYLDEQTLEPGSSKYLSCFLADMYRGISRFRLQTYSDVISVLEELSSRFSLAVVSDAQSCWALPEMRAVGILSYFNPIIISSDYGFRKPDTRLFEAALSGMELLPEDVIFVGNDMYRDIFGAGQLGLKTVFFSSNQGTKQMDGVSPDYTIYKFAELLQAIRFFEEKDCYNHPF